MNLHQLLDDLQQDADVMRQITAWECFPARPGSTAPLPPQLSPELARYLRQSGITHLYSHQLEAWNRVRAGRNVVVVTPTASGKTLCYNLPVLNTILEDSTARALYLFPTKALAQDQLKELERAVHGLGVDLKTHTYDGDTPAQARRAIRAAGHIVITNPDMLHTAILPHHTKWLRLFQSLRYVVIDELHQYRGVFGSHVANVIRRLSRILEFYGSNPTFITCSATIANPEELASRLLDQPVDLVDNNGAPSGERHLLFYNPPLVNAAMGIRKSPILSATTWASRLVDSGAQTIVFARSRTAVELLLTYLRKGRDGATVAGYRGGYLPRERRAIESGLRDGTIRAVAATNALELGIDIGSLDAAVLTGYPGSVSSTWQQVGRAGRRRDLSVAVMVAGSGPLDQYIVSNPQYFRGQPPESGLINPANLYSLVSHVKCGSFEMPFGDGESLGTSDVEQVLSFLESEGILKRAGPRLHWMSDGFPANDVSLRSASTENVVIIDSSGPAQVIGEVDRLSAPMLVHEGAIYLHRGRQYQVENLDLDDNRAHVVPVDVDYYTDANLAVKVKVLDTFTADESPPLPRYHGEVAVTSRATIYKKIRLFSHENVGWGHIHLPESQLHTEAFWFTIPDRLVDGWDMEDIQAMCMGLSNVIHRVSPVYLLSDYRDLAAVPEVKSPFTDLPTIYLYDTVPGGMGLSEKLYHCHGDLLDLAFQVVSDCACHQGCPSCVGPLDEVGPRARKLCQSILGGI